MAISTMIEIVRYIEFSILWFVSTFYAENVEK